MMPRRDLCTGFLYDRDHWSDYWEGTLKRDNLNIGTLTTQSVTWVGSYGVTDRVNVIAMVALRLDGGQRGHAARPGRTAGPHRWPSRCNAFDRDSGPRLAEGVRGGIGGARRSSDYTPDFYPLSLGSASQRASGRLTLNYTTRAGLLPERHRGPTPGATT